MVKYNPHKACSCRACRYGARSKAGKYVHRAINRKLRRIDREKLRADPLNYESTILSTPYTD